MPIQAKNRKRITGLDSRIFASLLKAQRPLSVRQIAKRVDITWSTANVHIQKLIRLNVLSIDKTIRKNRVYVNPKFTNYLRLNKILKEEIQLNLLNGEVE